MSRKYKEGCGKGDKHERRERQSLKYARSPRIRMTHVGGAENWREKLTDEQYYICWNKATEPPFSGIYHDSKEKGLYRCVCCGNPLFSSKTKFDSGTGWPSFWQPVSDNSVREEVDSSYGMTRTEVTCGKCGAHLGHIFDDGPKPTGMRYCINSLSLNLEREGGARSNG